MELQGIEEALKRGCRFYAFTSERKLRIVRLQNGNVMQGYGEHLHFEDAIAFANEDCRAGGRPYGEVYGKMYPHYLTGINNAISPLDAWVKRGRTFDAYCDGDEFVVELHGYDERLISFVQIGRSSSLEEALVWAFSAPSNSHHSELISKT